MLASQTARCCLFNSSARAVVAVAATPSATTEAAAAAQIFLTKLPVQSCRRLRSVRGACQARRRRRYGPVLVGGAGHPPVVRRDLFADDRDRAPRPRAGRVG